MSPRDQALAVLKDKFRGAMVGAVLGDALGAPLEFKSEGSLSQRKVLRQFEVYSKAGPLEEGRYFYTDDTAMARQLADSLAKHGALNESDLARRFTEEFYSEPNRGYGGGVIAVFRKLRKQDGFSEPLQPAREQFNGTGSYGNGAAMRVHPVALYCHGRGERWVEMVAKGSSLVTHAHKNGYNGAILQAMAVREALQNACDPFERLTSWADELCEGDDDDYTYATAMRLAKKCLAAKDDSGARELGNTVAALTSVPTAIYCAERARERIPGLSEDCEFARALQLAYTFGGDTDTIGSMTGAIVGARIGAAKIPHYLKELCEGVDHAERQADLLHKLSDEWMKKGPMDK